MEKNLEDALAMCERPGSWAPAEIVATELRRLLAERDAVLMVLARDALSADEEPDTEVTVAWSDDGAEGPGWYAWLTEYPQEGGHFLGVSATEAVREAMAGARKAIARAADGEPTIDEGD